MNVIRSHTNLNNLSSTLTTETTTPEERGDYPSVFILSQLSLPITLCKANANHYYLNVIFNL